MKKSKELFLSVIIVFFILLFPIGEVTAAETENSSVYSVGDVNIDNEINAKDVTILRRYIAGGWNETEDIKSDTLGDCNGDGNMNAKDVTYLRRYLADGWTNDTVLGDVAKYNDDGTRISDNNIVLNSEVTTLNSTLSENSFVSFDENTNTYVFTNINDDISNLHSGDKFVIQPNETMPNGCAIIVENVNFDGNNATIQSRDVIFSDIVESLDVMQTVQMTEDMITKRGEGVTVKKQVDELISLVELDKFPITDDIFISANITINPNVTADIDLHKGWFNIPTKIDRFIISLENELNANFKFEYEYETQILDKAKAYSLENGKFVDLFKDSKQKDDISERSKTREDMKNAAEEHRKKILETGIPIPAVPGLAVTVGWFININAEATVSIETEIELYTLQGVKLEDGTWSPISEVTNKNMSITGAADGKVYAGVGMDIGLTYCKVASINVSPEVGVEISAETELFNISSENDTVDNSNAINQIETANKSNTTIDKHDCWFCVGGDISLLFQIGADVTAIGYGALFEGDILPPKANKLSDFYISFGGDNHGSEWGWTRCPYNHNIKEDPKSGSTSYLGNTYKVFNIGMSWYDAKQYCEKNGGHLVTITSEEEQLLLHELTEKDERSVYWIGAHDTNMEGAWNWVTDEDWDYTNWCDGEPNNNGDAADQTQNYGCMPKSSNYQWDDVDVGDLDTWNEDMYHNVSIDEWGFVCEWEESE